MNDTVRRYIERHQRRREEARDTSVSLFLGRTLTEGEKDRLEEALEGGSWWWLNGQTLHVRLDGGNPIPEEVRDRV